MAFAAPKTDLVLATGGEADTGYDPLLGWSRYGHPLFKSTLLTRDADLAARRVAGNAMEAVRRSPDLDDSAVGPRHRSAIQPVQWRS